MSSNTAVCTWRVVEWLCSPNNPTGEARAMDDATLMQIITGKVQPAHAFFRGHVKVKGGMQMLIKLTTLLPIYFRKHTLRAKN